MLAGIAMGLLLAGLIGELMAWLFPVHGNLRLQLFTRALLLSPAALVVDPTIQRDRQRSSFTEKHS